MVELRGYEIWRGNQQIGWVEENRYIRARDNKRLGYYEGNYVHDMDTNKLSYIEGDYLYSINDRSSRIPLEKISESVTGGVFPEIAKCAIYVLLGA